MGMYAKDTTVSVDRSKAEIERLVVKYGAEGYSTAWSKNKARVEFIIGGRHIRMDIALPSPDDKRFQLTETGRSRSSEAAFKDWERECRAVWRRLKLIIHAKLEAVECGDSTYDREFMADIMLPDGRTAGQHVLPAIEEAYNGGKVKALLPAFK